MASEEYLSGLISGLYNKLQGNITEQEKEITSGLAFQDGFDADSAGGSILENSALSSKYFGESQELLAESDAVFEKNSAKGSDFRTQFSMYNNKRRAALSSLRKAASVQAPTSVVSGDQVIDPLTGASVGADYDPMVAFNNRYKRTSFDDLVKSQASYVAQSDEEIAADRPKSALFGGAYDAAVSQKGTAIFDLSSDPEALRKGVMEGKINYDSTMKNLESFYNTTAATSESRTRKAVQGEFDSRVSSLQQFKAAADAQQVETQKVFDENRDAAARQASALDRDIKEGEAQVKRRATLGSRSSGAGRRVRVRQDRNNQRPI